MLLTYLRQETKDFLAKLVTADAVRVDDGLFIINTKADWIDPSSRAYSKIEDFETVFDTDFHTFSWWEVCNEVQRIDEQRWKIGENVIVFLGLTPV